MISSAAFPKVAFSRPPSPSPVRCASSSVARPSQPASGTIASAAARKIHVCHCGAKNSSPTATGTKISSQLSIRRFSGYHVLATAHDLPLKLKCLGSFDMIQGIPMPLLATGPSPSMIETRQGAVECARFGRGPSVLLLHGAMGGYDQGLLLAAAAAGSSGFDFIAVSRPGYLGTPLALGQTPEQQADLCAALLDALAIPRAAVIAISGGGQCALQFALRHPGRCCSLVMISACSAPIAVRLPLRFHLLGLIAHLPAVAAVMRKKMRSDPDRAVSQSIPDPDLASPDLERPGSRTAPAGPAGKHP